MKLYTSTTSPYSRKARIISYELNLGQMVKEIQVDHWCWMTALRCSIHR